MSQNYECHKYDNFVQTDEDVSNTMPQNYDCYKYDKLVQTDEDSSNAMQPLVDITLEYTTPRNLYIERWKKKVLYPAQQYPLERLAILEAKHQVFTVCTCFFLKNSQLKEFVMKSDYRPFERYEEDPYPTKLVNEFSSTYVNRRARFYRQRGVIKSNKKQFTIRGKKIEDLGWGLDEDEEHLSTLGERISLAFTRFKSFPNSSSLFKSSSDLTHGDKSRRSPIWKRMYQAFC